jgi:hypothetical protein
VQEEKRDGSSRDAEHKSIITLKAIILMGSFVKSCFTVQMFFCIPEMVKQKVIFNPTPKAGFSFASDTDGCSTDEY